MVIFVNYLGLGCYTVLRRRLLDVVNTIMAYVLCELLLDIIVISFVILGHYFFVGETKSPAYPRPSHFPVLDLTFATYVDGAFIITMCLPDEYVDM